MLSIYSQGYAGKYLSKEKPGLVRELLGLLATATITTQVKIPDVSFYQGTINWDKMRAATENVIIRAGQNLWVDPKFYTNYAAASQRGMRRGVYWFYDDRKSPSEQANILISLLQNDRPELPIFADWENTYGGAYSTLGHVIQFMKLVEAGLPGSEVGIYTGYYWFKDHSTTMSAEQAVYLVQRPLWLAWYTSNAGIVQVPPPWTSVTFWQFGTPAVGSTYGVDSVEIDMSWYNGTASDFISKYDSVVVNPPPTTDPLPGEIHMGTTTYNLGIQTILDTYFGWGFRAVRIPAAAISKAAMYRPPATSVENVQGDLVFNFCPFLSTGPYLGLKVNGAVLVNYSEIDFNPFIGWGADNKLVINHQRAIFNTLPNAAQGFRYLLQNGVVNPLASSDWKFKAARRLVATNAVGDTILVTTKGVSGQEVGLDLFQACDLLKSLPWGIVWAVDGDSGGSAQDCLVVDGQRNIYRGDDKTVVAVPGYGIIKTIAPITAGTVVPPPVDPPPAGKALKYNFKFYDDGTYEEVQ